MAIINKVASDLTGKEGDENEFVTLVVREHPKLTEPKALDVFPDEIAGLKNAGDLVKCEVRSPNGTSYELIVPMADFNKLINEATLAKGRSTRGRRPGYSPRNGN